jgi:hypothetical protein
VSKRLVIYIQLIHVLYETSFVMCLLKLFTGNAHRGDIATNVTRMEFDDWLLRLTSETDAELYVHKHKTDSLYGAGRVTVANCWRPLLMQFANLFSQPHDTALFPMMPNFSVTWASVRKVHCMPMLCKSYRKYVETKVSSN